MNIYIPQINWDLGFDRRTINPLIRPFLNENNQVVDDIVLKKKWNIKELDFVLVTEIDKAHLCLFPYPLSSEYRFIPQKNVFDMLKAKMLKDSKLVCYIAGDLGATYPRNENIIYIRMGGFKSRENDNTITCPFLLSDYFNQHHGHFEIPNKPIIGFCGNANRNFREIVSGFYAYGKANIKRILHSHFDLEPFFISAHRRYNLLKKLEALSTKSKAFDTNFIYRDGYRAKANTEQERKITAQEYYDNIKQSTHILCIRGIGNFSVRYWETLMMGRIPIVIDTDLLIGHLGQYNNSNQINLRSDELDLLVEKLQIETYETMKFKMQSNRESFINGGISWVFKELKKY